MKPDVHLAMTTRTRRGSWIPFEVSLDSLGIAQAIKMEEGTPDLKQILIVAPAVPQISNVT